MARHRFFTLSPEILCAIGFDGRFKRVNPAFTETLGYRNEDLRKISLLGLVQEVDQASVRAQLEQLAVGGGAREFETRCVCADGQFKWLAWRAKAYPKDDCIYVAARDTTEQKRVEEQLRRYNRELHELSTAAQAATRAKSEFIANVSHELRTPLTAVLMMTDMLKSGASDRDQSAALETIERNSQYLLTLISELLDLSKIEAGKLVVEPVCCATRRIVDDVAALMSPRAAEKGLEFEVDIETPFPETILTDPTKLQQILLNLIENAIKFTERGGVRVALRMINDADRPQVEIDVNDTGIGVAEKDIESLFEPFTQGDSSSTRRFGGTGLGLAISRRLARLLGGDIRVVSEQGVGSTFTVRVDAGSIAGIPRITHDNQPPARVAASEPIRSAAGHRPLEGLRLLFAEDYPDIQRPVAYVLEHRGADVVIAENGHEAVELAMAAEDAKSPFDVILMDMQMPIVDGYRATQELRAAGCQRPIIALTAHAMESDRRKCLATGCDDYLAKPIDTEHLTSLIIRHARHATDVPCLEARLPATVRSSAETSMAGISR